MAGFQPLSALPSRVSAGSGPAPLSAQDTMQIGNQLPGLRMRSLIVGGVSEDKVSVRHGFRGCMQVPRTRALPDPRPGPPRQPQGRPAPPLVSLIVLLVFRKRVHLSNRPPNLSRSCFPPTALLLPASPRVLHTPPPATPPTTCSPAFMSRPEPPSGRLLQQPPSSPDGPHGRPLDRQPEGAVYSDSPLVSARPQPPTAGNRPLRLPLCPCTSVLAPRCLARRLPSGQPLHTHPLLPEAALPSISSSCSASCSLRDPHRGIIRTWNYSVFIPDGLNPVLGSTPREGQQCLHPGLTFAARDPRESGVLFTPGSLLGVPPALPD